MSRKKRVKGREEMEKLHNQAIRRWHTLCKLAGLKEEDKEALLSSYGVESSKDLDTHDLLDLCGYVSKLVDNNVSRQQDDKLRKQAIAAIARWLRATNQEESLSLIKGIACRIAGYNQFNQIPRERLRNIVYTFNNKCKDLEAAGRLFSQELTNHQRGFTYDRPQAEA